MEVLLLLVATALLAAAKAPLATARALTGTGYIDDYQGGFTQGNFRQCGGKGGSCKGSDNPKCKDARWPSNEDGKCATGLYCYRVSQWHWGCRLPRPTYRDADAAPTFAAKNFKQCGGMGGSCTDSKNAKCKDARWPSNQGGSCVNGLKCYRVSKYHWGCDTEPRFPNGKRPSPKKSGQP